ncbi:MAG TPA: pitrilysin family protein [Pseudonocardiaceae bacterium]|nr:pitrilysin family protein [Pseudonocardiaceae bacterium]
MTAAGAGTTLRNGVPVVLRRRPGADVTTVSVWVPLGSRHESAPGVTHLLEHVLMQATPPGRRLRVIDELESLGAEANALTARDHLALHARVPTPEAPGALRILADGLANAEFPEDLVEAERRVVDEELRLAAADPADIVHDVFFATAFERQQMGRPVGGTPRDVAALTCAHLTQWSRRNVRAGSVAVVVSGDVEPQAIVDLLDAGPLGDLPPGDPEPENRPHRTYGRADLTLNSDTAAVIVGGHGFALDDPMLPAAEVLIELLAGANSSVLHEEIRSRRGLTYDLWGAATGYRDVGVWRIGMSTAPEHRDAVVDLAGELLAGARAGGFTEAEVAQAGRRVAALLRLDAESSLEEVLRLGQHRLIGRDAGWTTRRHADALLGVEAADVAECARVMLDRFVIATAGRPAAATPEAARLAAAQVDRDGREEEPWSVTLLGAVSPR